MAFKKKSDPRISALDDLDKMLTGTSVDRMKARKAKAAAAKDKAEAESGKGDSPADDSDKTKSKFPPHK